VKLARFAAAALTLSVLVAGGCGWHEDCPSGCREGDPIVLDISCGGTDLTSVVLSGPCNIDNASAPDLYLGGSHQQYVYVQPNVAGTCHIELTFATGFTFSTDVHVTNQSDGDSQCSCQYQEPDPQTIAVNNPSTTCVDGGVGD
jgi:hypothetical protein